MVSNMNYFMVYQWYTFVCVLIIDIMGCFDESVVHTNYAMNRKPWLVKSKRLIDTGSFSVLSIVKNVKTNQIEHQKMMTGVMVL